MISWTVGGSERLKWHVVVVVVVVCRDLEVRVGEVLNLTLCWLASDGAEHEPSNVSMPTHTARANRDIRDTS